MTNDMKRHRAEEMVVHLYDDAIAQEVTNVDTGGRIGTI